MVQISTYSDFKKTKSLFFRENERIINKYNIEFISMKGVKIPLVCLYEIVSLLFENNSINLKISDIVLLTITAIGYLSKENKDTLKILFNVCKDKKILGYFRLVKNTIKSIKNLLNIIFSKEGVVIQNIEQALKYRYSVDVLSLSYTYLRIHKTTIKDFCYWFIVDQRKKSSRDLIEYISLNYYV